MSQFNKNNEDDPGLIDLNYFSKIPPKIKRDEIENEK